MWLTENHQQTTSYLTLHGCIHEVSVRLPEHDAMPPHSERLLIAWRPAANPDASVPAPMHASQKRAQTPPYLFD